MVLGMEFLLNKEATFLNKSKKIALIAVFAAIVAVCDSIPGIPQLESGVWYSWVFMITPLVAFLLGPVCGFFSILLGVMVGHYIYFRGPYELLFTLGAPIGAFIGSLFFRNKNLIPLLYFSILIAAYLANPISHKLPLWGIWNVFLAFGILLIFSFRKNQKPRLLICTLVCLEADILFRIFLFVPLETYQIFYGFSLEVMRAIWMAGALITPIQVGLALIFTRIAYPPIKKVMDEHINND